MVAQEGKRPTESDLPAATEYRLAPATINVQMFDMNVLHAPEKRGREKRKKGKKKRKEV